jgi:hypothetical protein
MEEASARQFGILRRKVARQGVFAISVDWSNRSVEDAPQIIDSTPPAGRAFIAFGGPQAHGHSINVAAPSTLIQKLL